MKATDWWKMSVAMAMVILSDRAKRRRWITGFLAVMVGYFAVGMWGVGGWLEEGLWRMLIYWGVLGGMCLFLVLFAVFDGLLSIQEERRKLGLGNPLEDGEEKSEE